MFSTIALAIGSSIAGVACFCGLACCFMCDNAIEQTRYERNLENPTNIVATFE